MVLLNFMGVTPAVFLEAQSSGSVRLQVQQIALENLRTLSVHSPSALCVE